MQVRPVSLLQHKHFLGRNRWLKAGQSLIQKWLRAVALGEFEDRPPAHWLLHQRSELDKFFLRRNCGTGS